MSSLAITGNQSDDDDSRNSSSSTGNNNYCGGYYQSLSSRDDDNHDPLIIASADRSSGNDNNEVDDENNQRRKKNIVLRNFIVMAVLFSANHGCVVSCLALATSRLGKIGAYQSGILMITYALSSVSGATFVVKSLGARNSMILGMGCYCFYVGCFYYVATLNSKHEHEIEQQQQQLLDEMTNTTANNNYTSLQAHISTITMSGTTAYTGSIIGGIGAGFLWTAQGTYFALASQEYSAISSSSSEDSLTPSAVNAKLAGYFAFWYLSEELIMRMLSSTLLEFNVASWRTIFAIYTIIAIGSTLAMSCVYNYPKTTDEDDEDEDTRNEDGNRNNSSSNNNGTVFLQKATVALKLLRDDPKMKHMIGLNAVFGFVSSFLNSYVNGQIVPIALNDPTSKYVGILTSTISIVAAIMSLLFGKIGGGSGTNKNDNNNKGYILILGAICFGGVVLPFVIQPDPTKYGWMSLICVYALHGTGRATFEGTLRSTFADYFSYEKEGAFANIILQNGIANGIGYILTFALKCDTPSRYCIEYSNGSLHDVWTFEFIALISVIVAVAGYIRASQLYNTEQQRQINQNSNENDDDDNDDHSSSQDANDNDNDDNDDDDEIGHNRPILRYNSILDDDN